MYIYKTIIVNCDFLSQKKKPSTKLVVQLNVRAIIQTLPQSDQPVELFSKQSISIIYCYSFR